MPSRLANSWSDRTRPVASSSNHVRPRAIALISAGSHRDLSFCCASPGSTSLVSAPRRWKATAAASSTALSRPSSDADAGTPPPNSGPHRSLIVSDWSSTTTFSTIGIGGHLAMPPLPHHRAYGSVPRRFGGLSSHQCLHWRQSETTETGFAEATVQGFREAQPPRSFWAEDGRTGRAFGDIEATEFAVALTARLPWAPGDATRARADPAVQGGQPPPLAEAEVAGPSPQVWD